MYLYNLQIYSLLILYLVIYFTISVVNMASSCLFHLPVSDVELLRSKGLIE